jgi:hypothetical protein
MKDQKVRGKPVKAHLALQAKGKVGFEFPGS